MDFEVVAEGLKFPEGPVWLPDGSVVVVEIAAGQLTRIWPDGRQTVVATPGGGPNGAALGPDGRLYVCNNGGFEWEKQGDLLIPGHQAPDYSGGRIEAIEIDSGAVEILYDSCDGHRLNGPNDLVFDGHGGFYFTDFGQGRERESDRGGLYYAKADGSEISSLLYPVDHPNGCGLSPDGRTLYVAQTLFRNVTAF
ncbi:SMP-30/gluconolactonase/LRE family protein, partial [Sphingobium indicum]|uniref:SMP-30/gluconolactonase/LRE family protein n=1 Tax=Sphingobium indicum TaxID=332055 RepID=UPI000567A873